MSYALVIPKELVREMYFIREKTGVSIRKQIIQAIGVHIDEVKQQKLDKSTVAYHRLTKELAESSKQNPIGGNSNVI